jgi:hypothetical protein
MESVRFLDLDCVRLANDALSLLVTQSVGPRAIALQLHGGANLFAELPDMTLDCPGAGPLTLWGGHRLWHAPESRRRTYLPDDRPVEITELARGVLATQPLEPSTGIQKALRITLPDESATVVVDHVLRNGGLWPVELAPWAITMLRPGGTAILSQATEPVDEDGLLPNRHLVAWPYTDVSSPHLNWGNRYVFVSATMEAGALKVGVPSPAGWVAYHTGDTLFVKKTRYEPGASYYDRGCPIECYCHPRFLELETLSPRSTLAPGASATHREVWELHPGIAFAPTEAHAQQLEADLGLSTGSIYLAEEN